GLVSKVNASHVQAFSSHEQGSLGQITHGKLHLSQKPMRAHTMATVFELQGVRKLPAVDILYDHQSAGLHLYEAAVNAGVQGIVVAGSGNGSLSPQAEKGLRLARRHGIACVRSSRTGSGMVMPSQSDARRGLIAAYALNPQKSRILLMLSLLLNSDR